MNQVVDDVIQFLHNHSDFRKIDMQLSLEKESPLWS